MRDSTTLLGRLCLGFNTSLAGLGATPLIWKPLFRIHIKPLQINDLQLNSYSHVQGSCRFLDPKCNIFFQDNSRENCLQLTFWANRPVADNPNPNPWYKTSLLESISGTGTRKTKDKQNFESQFPLFVMSQCHFCSSVRRFCITGMASCKGPLL